MEGLAGRLDSVSVQEAWDLAVAAATGAAHNDASGGSETAAGAWRPQAASAETAANADKEEDSWRDLYRIFIGSLRRSSAHIGALSLETLALGFSGLTKAHSGVWDEVEGELWGLEKREALHQLLTDAWWAGAFLSGAKTKAQLAEQLDLQSEADVAVFEPNARPLCPAFYIAVDWRSPRICIVVRGTQTWADTMTDLVAHSEPFMGGHCHSGMLAGARSIVSQHIGTIEELLKTHVGYQVQCIGHSLGGGVAALIATLLRTQHKERLTAALCKGVSAVGFGTPPVVTRELAEGCAPFVRTLVHNHDLVPRTCVASLAALQKELEGHRDDFFSSNKVAGFLRDSGVLAAGKAAAKTLFNAAMAGGAARAAARSPLGAAMVTLAAAKFKHLHDSAVSDAPAAACPATGIKLPSFPGFFGGGSGGGGGGSGGSGPSKEGGSGGSSGGAAAAEAAAGSGSGGEAEAAEAAEQRRRVDEKEAASRAEAMAGAGGGRYTMEEEEARVQLFSPGTLLFLKRSGAGLDAAHSLVQAPAKGGQRFERIVVNRAMLRDHLLSSITLGLHQLLSELKTAAAADAAEEAAAADASAAAAGAQAGTAALAALAAVEEQAAAEAGGGAAPAAAAVSAASAAAAEPAAGEAGALPARAAAAAAPVSNAVPTAREQRRSSGEGGGGGGEQQLAYA